MNITTLFIMAVALSMDAFAVSVSSSLKGLTPNLSNKLKISASFGFFQMATTIIGYFLAGLFSKYIIIYSNYIAFILLTLIGIKMIKESMSEEDSDISLSLIGLLILSIATSIDSLASGISFAFLNINIFSAGIMIGITTFLLSFLGTAFGNYLGNKFKKQSELAGGLIIIAIGIKILIEHLIT